jgi:hypothetical protein
VGEWVDWTGFSGSICWVEQNRGIICPSAGQMVVSCIEVKLILTGQTLMDPTTINFIQIVRTL